MESAFEGATARPAFPSRRAGRLRRIAARLPIYAANVRDNPQWLAMFILGRLLPGRKETDLTAGAGTTILVETADGRRMSLPAIAVPDVQLDSGLLRRGMFSVSSCAGPRTDEPTLTPFA